MPGASPPLVMTPIRFTATDYALGSGTIGFKERTLRTKFLQIAILAPLGGLIAAIWWLGTENLPIGGDARHFLVLGLTWISLPMIIVVLSAILSKFSRRHHR
jgi:hypothetical protein